MGLRAVPKLVLAGAGVLAWSLTMVKNGVLYPYGVGFWGPHGHDGIWHLSLAGGLSRGSLEMPIFAGQQIKNYHLGFDFLLALLHRFSGLELSTLYFQILPVLMALAIAVLTYYLVWLWQRSSSAALWAVFFTFFGGSWGWVVSWIRNGTFGGESMFWSQQAISTLINPPYALSLVILLAGMAVLLQYDSRPTRGKFFAAAILFGLLIQIKAYAGVLALAGLGIVALVSGVKSRKFDLLGLAVVSAVVAMLMFLPTGFSSGSLFVWQPGWFLETLMGLSDRFNWPRFYQAMLTYRGAGWWVKAVTAYSVAAGIFVIGNFGTRIFALFYKSKYRPANGLDYVGIFSVTAIGLGTVFPMLFVQTGTPWNTVQFFYYSQFFAGLFAGVVVARFLSGKGRAVSVAAACLLIGLTLPTTFDTLTHYLPSRPPAKISVWELEALQKIASLPDGRVFTPPFDADAARAAQHLPPRPLRLYESTAYVSAYSQHPVYLEDQVNLDITGYEWQPRRQKSLEFMTTSDSKWAARFLVENRIRYVYLPEVAVVRPRFSASEVGARVIWENQESAVWEVIEYAYAFSGNYGVE